MPEPRVPTAHRALRYVLYVDDSRFWHNTARVLGHYVRARGGTVTVLSSLLLPGKRTRALELAAELLGLPDSQVKLVARIGLIESTIPDLAREVDADLVVVGRLGSADWLTSGLIAHIIAKRTRCSTFIARGIPERLTRILVCTEGSRHGLINFERGADVAEAFGARLDVLHVVSQMGLTTRGTEELEAELRDFVASDTPEAEHLRGLRERIRARGLEGDVIVRSGLVVREVEKAVRDGGHDLVVIGAHEPGGRGHLYEDMGTNILRTVPVSTLMVKDRSAGDG